jgi:hypothetical protein
MAYENLGKVVPLAVASALAQFTLVNLSRAADGSPVGVVTGNGGPAIGVIQNSPMAGSASGDPNAVADVMVGPGITKVVAGGAFAAGDPLMATSAGRAVFGTTGSHIIGRAWTSAATTGDIASMLLQPSAPTAP